MPTVCFSLADPAAPEVHTLIELLDRYQESLYPSESNHLLPIDVLRQPNVLFLVVRVDGALAGCGAFVNMGDYAEIKRMFVLPEFRGLKLGRRLLEELERRALAAGLMLARLETGIHQPEALGLYERAGYRRRGPFGDYAADPLSVFMEKVLVELA
ncbi:MAG: GNAT family N-acetyltransferase [Planctomycetes bacterium]|nr:GNAT family N-acetyltransferase [Planctomycetota bacterium]